MSDPLTSIEMLNGMSDLAKSMRVFYTELIDEGFNKSEALSLTLTLLSTVMRPPLSNDETV